MIKRLLTVAAAAIALHGIAVAQTIKLGVVNIDTGPFAVSGAFVNDGAAFAVERLNAQGGALGRKYELITQNHAGTPASAIAAANRLVEQQGVSFFTGLNPSGTSLAIASKMSGLNALFIDATAASDDLTGKNCGENYFRVGITDGMMVNSFREQTLKSGIKNWDLLMADIAVGHDTAKRFTAAMQESGGKVNKTLFAPITASDLGSYIAQLLDKPADGLLMYYPSSGGIALVKQQQAFKLFEKYKVVLSASMVNEILIGAHGDASVGLWSAQSYFWTMPGERNAEFVKAFEARYKRKPTYIDADAYMSFELVHQAILKAKSAEVPAVRAALAGLKAQTVVGEVEMRAADHQLLRPLVVVQAAKAGEGKGEIVMKSIEPTAQIAPPVSPECKM
ncbi:ABC transporter substrate-binding protein [Variovorax sp. dw_954]|uniref:ABC transporter substrate-binding protein n=1 Tax=Variovorax sp. dw_954 TaxID=2720078 RepID=UPI001BD4AC69|nr:ABC transporter substrate-binding protein [Variovorax sp. dw_954]